MTTSTLRTPEIHASTIDGVRVRWIEAPPPYTATLMFRVGRYDETLATTGITHLVEHLALLAMRGSSHPYNGSVNGTETSFVAAGTPDDISSFLTGVCANLDDLPLRELDTVARVLGAEALGRSTSTYTFLLSLLFGPNGPGLLDFAEHGLGLVSPDEVVRWSQRHFTKQNALLVLTGPPPESLCLPLPTGHPHIVSLPDPELGLRPDGHVIASTQPAGICMGGIGARSTPLTMAVTILGKRLQDRLRHELGLVYAASAAYDPISIDDVYVFLAADCEEAHAPRVSAEFMRTIRDFLRHGPTDEEIDDVRKMPPPELIDDTALARAEIHRLGRAELLAEPIYRLEDLADMRDAATKDEIRDSIGDALRNAFVVPHPSYDAGLYPRPRRNDLPVIGKTYRARRPKPGELRKLVIGDDGVSALTDERCVTARFDEVAIVECPSPSARTLIRQRGGFISIEASGWWRGERMIADLDARLPKRLVLGARDHEPPDELALTGAD